MGQRQVEVVATEDQVVADRYNVSRDAQDEYAFQSQMRTAKAQQEGKFDDEIVPLTTNMKVMNKETKEISDKEVTLAKDEGNRPETTLEGLQSLKPVFKDGLNIQEGNLAIGSIADICIFNPEQRWTVNEQNWLSQGRNTPFWGQTLQGKTTQVIKSGAVINA